MQDARQAHGVLRGQGQLNAGDGQQVAAAVLEVFFLSPRSLAPPLQPSWLNAERPERFPLYLFFRRLIKGESTGKRQLGSTLSYKTDLSGVGPWFAH